MIAKKLRLTLDHDFHYSQVYFSKYTRTATVLSRHSRLICLAWTDGGDNFQRLIFFYTLWYYLVMKVLILKRG